MSGIVGVIRLDGAAVAASEIEAMLARMACRGPDRQQSWSMGNAGFGQVLLATTPEALAEVQPWQHAQSGCIVVSDSRLDNRSELLSALEIAGSVDDIGDGELLCAAWQRWGRECTNHLLGDFSFAIWDPRNRRLFCARDHMGVRPLYYHHAAGRLFAFASEPCALLALPQVPETLNEGRIADFLCNGMEGFDKTSSLFEAIFRLQPAHTLELDEGSPKLHEYWTPVDRPPFDRPVSEQAWIDGLEALVYAAVQCRMRGHGRIGSMLSGGLDSSTVVAIASMHLAATGQDRLPTYSAVSSAPGCPETRAVSAMLERFSLDATLLDPAKIPDMLNRIAETLGGVGEPFDAWMSMIDCQYLAASKQGVRVVLDGIDPDSLLAHGDYLSRLVARGRWLRAWRESRELARFCNSPYSIREWLLPAVIRGVVPAVARGWLRKWRPKTPAAASLLLPSAAARIGMAARKLEHASLIAASRARLGAHGATKACDSPYLLAGIERYGRVASRRGIEPRHPFLDRRLVEYCAWLPMSLRLRDGYPKWALRKAMTSRLPHAVAWRRGKEHLGWQFNLSVLNRRPALPDPPCPPDHPLARFLNANRMPLAASGADWHGSDLRWDDAFTVHSLKTWFDQTGYGQADR